MAYNELGLPTFPGPLELARDLLMQGKWQKGNVSQTKRGLVPKRSGKPQLYEVAISCFFFILR